MTLLAPPRTPPAPPTGRLARDTPARRLAREALRVLRLRRDPDRLPDGWREPAFVREVELVRAHLRPLRSRAALAASFGREAFAMVEGDGGDRDLRAAPVPGPVTVAYAMRWLELGPPPRPGTSGSTPRAAGPA